MQCSWWWIFLPCAAANFFSGHLRAPQPWHPHLVHVRDGAAGAAELRRRQEPRAEQEPVPAPLVAFTQLSRCPCPEDTAATSSKLAPTQRSVSAPARLAPTMPMPAPMRPALAVLRQAEWQLEAQEVGLQQQIVQLREQIREAQDFPNSPTSQVFSPMPGPSLIQAMPPAAPMTNSWQWVPSYGNYGQYGQYLSVPQFSAWR